MASPSNACIIYTEASEALFKVGSIVWGSAPTFINNPSTEVFDLLAFEHEIKILINGEENREFKDKGVNFQNVFLRND